MEFFTDIKINTKNVKVLQNNFKNHESHLRREAFLSYKRLKVIAEGYSVRMYTLDVLEQMGHPYSKVNPNPPMDPAYINIQNTNSPPFNLGWRVYTGRNFVSLTNVSRSAIFIQLSGSANSRMMLRPIFRKLQNSIKPLLRRALRTASDNYRR